MIELYILESDNAKMFRTLCDVIDDTDEDVIAAFDGSVMSFELKRTIRGTHVIELLELLGFKKVRSINK